MSEIKSSEVKSNIRTGPDLVVSYTERTGVIRIISSKQRTEIKYLLSSRLSPLRRSNYCDLASPSLRTNISSQQALMGIMDKTGPLHNPADRDHSVQYVVAVGLIHGKLDAADPRIDALRAKVTVTEDPRYTREFVDPKKRSSANAIQITFKDGSRTPKVEVEFPFGHPRRLKDAGPVLRTKFERSLARRFGAKRVSEILSLCDDVAQFERTPVREFMGLLAV